MKTEKTPRTFQHLDQSDRDRMQILLAEGILQKDVAVVLHVHPSTISRERRHCRKDGVYDAENAQHKSNVKRSNSKYQGMKIEKDTALKERIITELKTGRSPDEIAGMFNLEGVCVGKDAIYKWLYSAFGNKYCKYLCTRKYKVKHHKSTTKRTLIPNRVSITERPEEGMHAEADTLVSPKNAHTTECASMVVVQKTKLMSGNRLPGFSPVHMEKSIKSISEKVSFTDLTFDNGIENRNHEQLPVPAYFCAAHHPWEKPLVEQSIGILRRWCFPKGTDLSKISEERYQHALHYLNHKKRKSLGYKSAYEASLECGIISELSDKEIAFDYRI